MSSARRGEGWGRGEARRGAPLRWRRPRWREKSQIDVKCAEVRAGAPRWPPRHPLWPMVGVGVAGAAARSAAAAAFFLQLYTTKNSHFDAKCAEVRREAPLRRRRRFHDHKNGKWTSNAPRPAREVLVDRCDHRGGGKGGAKLLGASTTFSLFSSALILCRLLADASKYFSHGLRVLRSHLLTLYPSGKLDEDASTSSLAFSSRSRSISTHL
ncbi:hypothetical protein GGG16DRAFT_119706 [Schizophyllum commune]